jgi:nitrogen fixation protein FixH
MPRSAEARRRRSLIPWLFAAAMLPVFAANGALIYLALQSKPALVDAHPFVDGLTYNRELAAARAQQGLGWNAALEPPRRAAAPAPVAVTLRDRSGAPVTGLAVALTVRRPVGALPDRRLALAETGPGRYAGAVTLPLSGQWQFDIVARRGDDQFVYARRVVIR